MKMKTTMTALFCVVLSGVLLLVGCTATETTKADEDSLSRGSESTAESLEERPDVSTEPDTSTEQSEAKTSPEDGGEKMTYKSISQQEAKAIMDADGPYIVLDVREQYEYDEGHIPGAILIPHEQIAERCGELLPDKNAVILVYCRSGRRSQIASEALAGLGYSNVLEFGGIIDWPYDVVT